MCVFVCVCVFIHILTYTPTVGLKGQCSFYWVAWIRRIASAVWIETGYQPTSFLEST